MRLIDADALWKSIKKKQRWVVHNHDGDKTNQGYLVDDVLYSIDNAPTIDAVPVVRCKDCKYSLKWMTGKISGEDIRQCYVWGVDTYPRAYEYCSRGVRRESEETNETD